MRAFGAFVIVTLASFAFSGLAIPVSTSLAQRSQFCQNAPATVAGTMLDRRENKPILWCSPHSETYVVLVPVEGPPPDVVNLILISGRNSLRRLIQTRGDRLIDNGHYLWGRRDNTGVLFRAWNANNHQLTYGVVCAALEALLDYMGQHEFSGASFNIYDGQNEVGKGVVDG